MWGKMNINTDYAQYWAYGHKDEPIEPPKPKQEDIVLPEIIKKHTELPSWLNKKIGKAKL